MGLTAVTNAVVIKTAVANAVATHAVATKTAVANTVVAVPR
ncbi:hypothetical protein ACN3XK_14155 [Actinomadura welshii]